VAAVFSGHIHAFEAVTFTTGQPPQFVFGYGGTAADGPLPDPFPPQLTPLPGAVVRELRYIVRFGFATLDRPRMDGCSPRMTSRERRWRPAPSRSGRPRASPSHDERCTVAPNGPPLRGLRAATIGGTTKQPGVAARAPYRAGLAVVFAAMLVETLMSLAAPWPLKVVLDNALGHHPLPQWLEWVHDLGIDRNTMGLALFAALATALIAAIGAVASYVDNYYTESVGQWVAHDLRMRIYDHLHRLSLKYLRGPVRRHAALDDDERRGHRAGLCVVVDAVDRRRHDDHRRHARADVLAQLGLRADRRGHHAVPAAVRHALQEGREGGDA
jgi:hypothetical protein